VCVCVGFLQVKAVSFICVNNCVVLMISLVSFFKMFLEEVSSVSPRLHLFDKIKTVIYCEIFLQVFSI